jgi:hypothetical protein
MSQSLKGLTKLHSLINSLVGNSVPIIAIAKSCGWSVTYLANWSVEQYYAKGYHDVWISKHGKANADVYADFFAQSRRYVSKHESIVRRSNTQIRIISAPLYLSNPPEALFFSKSILKSYVRILTRSS